MQIFQGKHRPILFSVLIILATISLAYYQFITVDKNFNFTELLFYWSNGNAAVKHNFLTYHQIGLWDNFVGLGYPSMAHLTSQFYPITFIGFFIHDFLFSLKLQVFLHFLLAGCACFYLLKVLKCNTYAATLGAITYVINDYALLVAYRGFLSEILSSVWMPLSIAFLWKALFDKKRVFFILTGIALAMHVISMGLYSLYFTYALLFFLMIYYFLYETVVDKKNVFTVFSEILISGVIISVVFIGISAIKLFPVFEYSKLSVRDYYTLYGSKFWDFSTFDSVKNYLTNFLISSQVVPLRYKLAVFISPIINSLFLLLVFISIFKKSKEVVFFFVVSILSVWAALAKNAPIDLYSLFYHIIPGLKSIAFTWRFLIIANVALPVLASLGLTYVAQKTKNNYVVLFIVFIIALPSAVYVRNYLKFQVRTNSQYETFQKDSRNIFNYQLAKLIHNEKEPVHAESTYILDSKSVQNYSAVAFDFMLVNSPIGGFDLTYQHFPFYVQNENSEFIRKKYKLLYLMNVKYLATSKQFDDYPNNYSKLRFTKNNGNREDGSIYEINKFAPLVGGISFPILLIGKNDFNDFKAFEAKVLMLSKNFDLQKFSIFSSRKEHLSDFSSDELLKFAAIIFTEDQSKNKKIQQLLDLYKKNGGKVLALHFRENNYSDLMIRSDSIMTDKPAKWLGSEDQNRFITFLSTIDKSNIQKNVSVKLKIYTPEYIQIITNTEKNNTPIRIAQTYYPGWKAYLDGKEIPLYMSDGLVTGFIVDKMGKHKIDLKFEPMSFYFGAMVTVLTITSLVGYFLFLKTSKNNS